MRNTSIAGVVIAVIAIGLGGADYWFKERPFLANQQTEMVEVARSSTSSEDATETSSEGSRTVVKKGQSTKKREGPNVAQVFDELGVTAQSTREVSILNLVHPNVPSIVTNALLIDNDRAGLFSWIDSPDVKDLFGMVKESLQQSFSSDVAGLIDESRTQEDGPTYDYLTFTDNAISAEKVVFVRVRTRLYEFRIVKGKEDAIYKVIGELIK